MYNYNGWFVDGVGLTKAADRLPLVALELGLLNRSFQIKEIYY